MSSSWDVNADVLTPCSSISTYGKIISNAGKPRPRQSPKHKTLFSGDHSIVSSSARAELNTKEAPPPKPGAQRDYWSAKGDRPSPCFMKKGNLVHSTEVTPGPSHYSPQHSLVRPSHTACIVHRVCGRQLTSCRSPSQWPSRLWC
eukprot:TRINITY_DN2778_c0_g1_i3.p1 TRINITY_DN2778_c0_g1~~TRINITY_DN2778_c0_g1_i3.p1  ORF type:complete len:145 (-),score=12.84 TRINITY_DN2778_c0_g1_i3:295-729(-)